MSAGFSLTCQTRIGERPYSRREALCAPVGLSFGFRGAGDVEASEPRGEERGIPEVDWLDRQLGGTDAVRCAPPPDRKANPGAPSRRWDSR